MDRRLQAILARARRDRVSGASDIALMCAQSLRIALSRGRRFTEDDLREFSLGLTEAQPNMAPLWNLANDLLLSTLSPEEVTGVCRRAERHHAKAPRVVGRAVAAELSGKTVVTNSASAAVFEALVPIRGRPPPEVLVPESRPMEEGLKMAARLARRGVRVTLFADSSISRAVRLSDVALVGADAVTSSAVIGKIGILNLALSSREYGRRCLVCADTSKFFPLRLCEEQRRAREIVPIPPRGVKVDNSYFEEARLGLFSEIVTEAGRLSAEAASRMALEKRVARELRPISSL